MKVITKAVLDTESMEWLSVEYYEYNGPVDLCCGPSGQEQALANQEASFSTALNNAFSTRFATQNDILNQVQTSLGQLQSGNYPPGYSPTVMATLQTNALNQVAGATASAKQAAANAFAGQGAGTPVGAGGGSGVPSGIQANVQGNIAAQGATEQANLLSNLNLQNYNVGRENLIQSISGLQTLAGAENPLGFAQSASGANSQAFGQANTINQQQNQETADIVGGITGIATGGLSALATGGLGALAGGVSPGGVSPGMQTQTPVGFDPSAGDYLNQD